MANKRWKNKVGQGYSIELIQGYFIKVISWHGYDFIEVKLIGPCNRKGYINILSNRLAYSEHEIERHIQSCKYELQNILERQADSNG